MLALGCGSPLDGSKRYPAMATDRDGSLTCQLVELFSNCPAPKLVYRSGMIAMQGQPADMLYQVISGTVRCYLITEDGHRQVVRFAGPGAIIGATVGEEWPFTAEAIDDVVIRACPRETLDTALREDGAMRSVVQRLLWDELAHREQLLVMVSHMHADDRLLAFLIRFTGQAVRCGDWIRLPMGRQDLADHLGLSFETVSRAFSALKRRGDIAMNGSDRYRVLAAEHPQSVAA